MTDGPSPGAGARPAGGHEALLPRGRGSLRVPGTVGCANAEQRVVGGSGPGTRPAGGHEALPLLVDNPGRPPFLARLARRGVLFDGAMTTMLRAAGWPADRPVELANAEAPELVLGIHQAYRRAGAEVLTANTFGAHGLRLGLLPLADRVEELCAAGIALAREAAGTGAYVAASVGPPGEPIFPLGDKSYRVAVEAYRRQLAACRTAGVDLFVLETFTDVLELQAALTAAHEAAAAPLAVTMALRPDRLAAGLVSVEALAEVAAALGAAVIGLNCMPPPQTASALERLAARSRLPLFAQPSAGPPTAEGGYPITPEEFAEWARPLVSLGLAGLGGCCGTTPEHVVAVGRALADGD